MAENIFTDVQELVNTALSQFFTKLIIAVVILLVGFIIGRILGRLTQKLLHEIELNKILKKATRLNIQLEHAISIFITYFIYFIFIIVALEKIGIGAIAFNLLAAGVIIIIIISIFLGIKDFVPNAIAGLFIHTKRRIEKGDIIKFKGIQGTVQHVNLIETRIETGSGDILYIPNTNLTKSELVKIKKKKS